MTAQTVGHLLAVGLLALFAASAFAKAAYWEESRAWFGDLFPRLRPSTAIVMVVGGEVGIAICLVVTPSVGGLLAALWLLTASVVLWSGRRRVASCGCFGRRQRLGPAVAVRNAGAFAAAVGAAALAGAERTPVLEIALAAALIGMAVVVTREALDRKGVVV